MKKIQKSLLINQKGTLLAYTATDVVVKEEVGNVFGVSEVCFLTSTNEKLCIDISSMPLASFVFTPDPTIRKLHGVFRHHDGLRFQLDGQLNLLTGEFSVNGEILDQPHSGEVLTMCEYRLSVHYIATN